MLSFFKKLFGKKDEFALRFDEHGRPMKTDVKGEVTLDYEQLEREDPVYYTIPGRKTVKLNVNAEIKDGDTIRYRDFDGYGSDLILKIRLTGRAKRPDDNIPGYMKPPPGRR